MAAGKVGEPEPVRRSDFPKVSRAGTTMQVLPQLGILSRHTLLSRLGLGLCGPCRTHPSLSPHQGITFHVRSAFPRHPAGGEASPPSLQRDLQASGLCFCVFNKEDPSLHFQCPSASAPCELQDSPAKALMITLFL